MSCRKQALAMIAIAGMSANIWASEMSLEDCGRTAETFAFMADVSGSMMQTVGHMKSLAQRRSKKLAIVVNRSRKSVLCLLPMKRLTS